MMFSIFVSIMQIIYFLWVCWLHVIGSLASKQSRTATFSLSSSFATLTWQRIPAVRVWKARHQNVEAWNVCASKTGEGGKAWRIGREWTRRWETKNAHWELRDSRAHGAQKFLFLFAFVSQNSKWCFCRYSWVLESPRQQYMLCVCMSSAIAAMCMCVFVYDVSLIRLKSEQFRSNDAGIMLTVDRARVKELKFIKIIKSFSFALCTPARVISGGTWREEDVREKQEQRKMDFRHVVF